MLQTFIKKRDMSERIHFQSLHLYVSIDQHAASTSCPVACRISVLFWCLKAEQYEKNQIYEEVSKIKRALGF